MSIPRRTQLLTIEVTYRADEPRPDTWDWSTATSADVRVTTASDPTDLMVEKTTDEIAYDLDDDRFGPQDTDLDPEPAERQDPQWTLVGRRPRGRYFRPIAGAPVGTWREAQAAANRMTEWGLDVWYVPTREAQETAYVAPEDRDNILIVDNDGKTRRVPIRWDATPVATFPRD